MNKVIDPAVALESLVTKTGLRIEQLTEKRNNTISKLATASTAGDIEFLIQIDAELNASKELKTIIKNLVEDKGMSAEDVFAHLTRSYTRQALNTHFANSSSNIYLEIELRQRQQYAIIAADLNGF